MVSTTDSESVNPGSNLGGASNFIEIILVNKIYQLTNIEIICYNSI